MTILNAYLEDLDYLANLHEKHFHKDELSIQLGINFISEFYRLCIVDDKVSVLVLKKDDKTIGISIVFFKYSQFSKMYSKKIAAKLIKLFISLFFQLKWKKIYNILRSAISSNFKKYVPKNIYDFHIGSIILDKKYRLDPKSLVMFGKMFSKNIELLESKAISGIWGSCLESNTASLNFMKGKGLDDNKLCESYPEPIFVNVKHF